MKLKTLVESREALTQIVKAKMPIAIGWNLKSFFFEVKKNLENFDTIRNNKIIEFGTAIEENGKPTGRYNIPIDRMAEFNNEIGELLEIEIDIFVPEIKFETLKSFKDSNDNPIEIELESLIMLDWLIKD